MNLKMYNNDRLAYGSKNVFKTVGIEPVLELNINKFEFNDYINSSVTVVDKTGVDMNTIKYVVVDNKYHYFVTSIQFLSKGKYELGLVRNAWAGLDLESVNMVGTVRRGMRGGADREVSVAHYKPNSISFDEQKQAEYPIVDKYGLDALWGILYCSNTKDNKTININSSEYVITGDALDPNKYYYGRRLGNVEMSLDNNIVIFTLNKSSIYPGSGGYYGLKYTGCKSVMGYTGSDYRLDIVDRGIEGAYAQGYETDAMNSFMSNAICIRVNDTSGSQDLREFLREQYAFIQAILTGVGTSEKSSMDADFYGIYNPEYPVSLGAYLYNNKENISNRDGQCVTNDGIVYKTSINWNQDGIYDDFRELLSLTVRKSKPEYGDNPLIPALRFGTGFEFISNVDGVTCRNYLSGAKYAYTELTDVVTAEINCEGVTSKSIILKEPYGILAMPLFDVESTDGVVYKGLQSQELFYNLISQYSGSSPFIIDAQIIPYAPNDFSVAWTEGRIDMSKLVSALNAVTSSTYKGFPPCVVSSADISVVKAIDVGAFDDVQKEYTLNKYRIKAPSQSSSYDFKYYTYANNSESLSFNIDITLKPFGLYAHCSPVPQQGAIGFTLNFDDIHGCISDKGVFESTITSNAFETYKRENSMYEDIQDRKIGTLEKSQNVERTNESVGAVIGTLQATAMGGMAGAGVGGKVGSAIGAGLAGVAAGAAYAYQYNVNEGMRARELSDAEYFYEANLKTIQALPDTVSRVSSFNQDIARKFYFFVEKYGAPSGQEQIYDNFVAVSGDSLDVPCDIRKYLGGGRFIQASIFSCNLRPEIYTAIKNDLEKGVYYNEQI